MDLLSQFIPIAHAAEEAAAASPGIAEMFGLNLKLFVAQLFNFAVVLLVLWKWVFTPVTKALKSRTEKIEQSLANAEHMETARREFDTWKEQALAEARKESAEIVAKAKSEAEVVRQELLAKTKQEQDALVQEGAERLKQEQKRVVGEAKAELADIIVNATERLLREKLSDPRDKELAQKALQSLQ